MKRLLILLGLPLVLSSCLLNEEDKFPKSATERMNEAIEQAENVLQGAVNGWRVELYPEKSRIYGGYTMFLKFSSDGKVTAASENFDPAQTDESYYSVEPDNGPMLTFNTYNEIIHFYSDAGTGANQGIGTANGGLEGDSDFIVMEATPECVKLKGRKSGNYIRMYPLDEGVNWADELQAYVDAEKEMLLGYTSCIVGDATYPLEFQSALNNFTSRVFRITLKEATETESAEVLSAPFIWTKSGAKFYEPLTIDGVTVEELSFSGEYLENAEKNVRITPKYSDNQLTVNITETTYNSLKYEITATDPDDPYIVRAFRKSEIEGMSDTQLRKSICETIASANELKKGDMTGTLSDLYDETEYVVVGLGIDPSTLNYTTKVFSAEKTTSALPADMQDAYRQWIGTWTVTSASSEVSGTSYDFVIEIRPREINSTYLIRGWGYTYLKNDYECEAKFKADGTFDIHHQICGTLSTGGQLTLFPRFVYTKGGSGYGGLISLGYGEALQASSSEDGKGAIYGYNYGLSGGGSCTITSLDYWDVRNGSNYYIQAMSPYVYKDFFAGPYTMVRTSTEYGVLGTRTSQSAPAAVQRLSTGNKAAAVRAE